MILTDEIQQQLVDLIEYAPDAALVLPEHAYGAGGRVIVLVDGIPIDLHRHLYGLLIRPLGYYERMHDDSGVPGNVNPHLFTLYKVGSSWRTHCPKGHDYAGNEAPPNTRGYRCLTCLRDSRRRPGAQLASRDRTQCPQGHDYTTENTYIDSAGKRRCLICTRKQKREYMARRRKERTNGLDPETD